MKTRRRAAFSALILFGISVATWYQAESSAVRFESGLPVQFWLQPDSVVAPETFRWTWGVDGRGRAEPDAWFFHVFVSANVSVRIELVWMIDRVTLYQSSGKELTDMFKVELPRDESGWRWDWRIINPNRVAALVYNFTVYNYSITYTNRGQSEVLRKASVGFAAAGTIALALIAVGPRLTLAFERRKNI